MPAAVPDEAAASADYRPFSGNRWDAPPGSRITAGAAGSPATKKAIRWLWTVAHSGSAGTVADAVQQRERIIRGAPRCT